MTAAIVLIASAYGLAGLLLLLKRSRSGLALFTLGTVVNWGLMCWEWWFSGHPPLANMSHVLVFLGGVFGPLYLGFAIPRGMAWLAPLFPFAAGVPLLISLTMERDELWRLMPALQSPWFVPHVASYMVSYALAALGQRQS
jgi:ABC-type transport system involved in cytochrome c biogenesis permease subunit